MTDRDAYWGAKLVTSFSDAQIAAIVAEAHLPVAEAAYLTRALRVAARHHRPALPARRDGVEAPHVAGDGRQRVCFDDLAIARGYADAARACATP